MVISNKKAFSLIELLVVISIIGTLMAIMLPNFMGSRDRAADSRNKQQMLSIKNALRMFYNDTQNYPNDKTSADYVDLGTTLVAYMPSINNVGFTFDYYQTDNGDGFQICSRMNSDNNDSMSSQLRCADNNGNVCGVGVTTVGNFNLYVVCAK